MEQVRCIVSVKGKQEVICALSNSYVGNDLVWPLIPKTTPNATFRIVVGERSDFKLSMQVYYS